MSGSMLCASAKGHRPVAGSRPDLHGSYVGGLPPSAPHPSPRPAIPCRQACTTFLLAVTSLWLDQQHTDAHELLVTLLHYVPEPDRTRAPSQLTTGELRHLARLLADTTDLRQIARAIVADLQHHLPAQQRPNGS